MRFDIEGAAVAEALGMGIHERRSTLPILSHALIEAEGDKVRLTTTDLEAYFTAELTAKVTEAGSVCADANLLRAAGRPGSMRITHGVGEWLQAAPHGGSKLRIGVLPAAEFPAPISESWTPLQIDAAALGRALRAVAYAAGKGLAKYYFNGVALCRGYVGATDGHRGAMFPLDYTGPELIIPTDHIASLQAILVTDAKIDVVGDGDHMRMLRASAADRQLVVRLVDGKPAPLAMIFGDYRNSEQHAVFDRIKLLAAAKQFAPFTERVNIASKNLARAARFSASDGAAAFSDAARESTENCSWALAALVGSIDFCLSLPYLMQALAAIETEKVHLYQWKATTGSAVLVIDPVGEGDPAHSHIVTAMTL